MNRWLIGGLAGLVLTLSGCQTPKLAEVEGKKLCESANEIREVLDLKNSKDDFTFIGGYNPGDPIITFSIKNDIFTTHIYADMDGDGNYDVKSITSTPLKKEKLYRENTPRPKEKNDDFYVRK